LNDISYRNLGFSPLFCDYIEGVNAASAFYPCVPDDLDAICRIADSREKAQRPNREVANILAEQNASWGAPEEVARNVEKLRDGALAVVTGQQIGLFGGPLYNIAKALTAVRLTEVLSERLGADVVPVFWLATCDSDFPEVQSCTTMSADGSPFVQVYEPRTPSDPDLPVGGIVLDDGVDEIVEALAASIPDSEFSQGARDVVAASYRSGVRMADAFARLVLSLLGRFGLVMFDPMHDGITPLIGDILMREVERPIDSSEAILCASRCLASAGYHRQLTLHEGILNLFVFVNGLRRSVKLSDDGFIVESVDGIVSSADLASFVSNGEACPNVALRPVVQDSLLPTVAYVAGPNELAYFAQLGGVYQLFDVPQPAVLPRAGFTIMEPHVKRDLERLGISLSDFLKNPEGASASVLRESMSGSLSDELSMARKLVERTLSDISRRAVEAEPGMKQAGRSMVGRVLHQYDSFADSIYRAHRKRSETTVRKLKRLENALCPGGSLQERVYSVLAFLPRHGERLFDVLHDVADPFVFAHRAAVL
jgi:bacillithiol biosynthesis cysteine-adding enzyme BshC